MASVYDLKPRFQDLLRPVVGRLARAGVSANQVTVAALLLSVVIGVTIGLLAERAWPLLLLPLALFVRMALNAIDGMLAREHAMASPLGAILNELGDVLSDAALYLPLCWVAGLSPVLVVAVVVAAVIVEMTGVVAVQIGASRRYDGPMGKSDRALAFGTLGLLIGLGVEPQPWADWVLALLLLLSLFTIFNRGRQALREIA
ncbi:MAG: CDP-alcohol phosphatidyltransferase family protein [Gammaproteobacteria bacterium]|nr:CDP-alcohol phosphatidyltransferase family protein [Gammaproteobacteria bacterium]